MTFLCIVPGLQNIRYNGEMQWTKGDITGANPMSQHTAAIVSAVLTELIALMKDDETRARLQNVQKQALDDEMDAFVAKAAAAEPTTDEAKGTEAAS